MRHIMRKALALLLAILCLGSLCAAAAADYVPETDYMARMMEAVKAGDVSAGREAAARLLNGERVLCEPSVVFQANARIGSGVFRELRDSLLGSTYLCYSSRPELYEA